MGPCQRPCTGSRRWHQLPFLCPPMLSLHHRRPPDWSDTIILVDVYGEVGAISWPGLEAGSEQWSSAWSPLSQFRGNGNFSCELWPHHIFYSTLAQRTGLKSWSEASRLLQLLWSLHWASEIEFLQLRYEDFPADNTGNIKRSNLYTLKA